MEFLRAMGHCLLFRGTIFCAVVLAATFFSLAAAAGPYRPAAGESGSWAIHMDDSALVAWATGWENYSPGQEVDAAFQAPQLAVGQAVGNSFDIVSLGRGGQITMTFDEPIQNGDGWDFAVFENSFSDSFLELAHVEVSSNGVDFYRFDNDSLTPSPVSGFGAVDPTNIDGLAGKYKQGYGTPFDLEDVGLDSATHIRIIDVVGDGMSLDTSGDVIYDPYPTFGSAGFDLDAIGVSNGAAYPSGEYTPPPAPSYDGKAGFAVSGGCFIGACLSSCRDQ
ncbi:MAG: PEP-CTERM sorting domain-containing protein [Deltaproteobacteria bacterium]|nr:PEP-CTERM sorting domain-containing protein [Deltaproteobacteria bacterium]